ncbi:MAG: hypothetical protein K6C34_04045, partial [Alphaproteobacteria bacterium]|nr:hypothetical protein [Alphaproteobacteria bacterium]
LGIQPTSPRQQNMIMQIHSYLNMANLGLSALSTLTLIQTAPETPTTTDPVDTAAQGEQPKSAREVFGQRSAAIAAKKRMREIIQHENGNTGVKTAPKNKRQRRK